MRKEKLIKYVENIFNKKFDGANGNDLNDFILQNLYLLEEIDIAEYYNEFDFFGIYSDLKDIEEFKTLYNFYLNEDIEQSSYLLAMGMDNNHKSFYEIYTDLLEFSNMNKKSFTFFTDHMLCDNKTKYNEYEFINGEIIKKPVYVIEEDYLAASLLNIGYLMVDAPLEFLDGLDIRIGENKYE